ncbi:DUF2332 family protein [Nocardia jinanensis]|uniref:DUF2332 family protein n=1 Tax=Nocardia jinanensis TaxID=382504 RepID=UPI0022771A6C|nr:DUF2332 family protein [Nocardia jinanensis]
MGDRALQTELIDRHTGTPPIPDQLPTIAGRTGIDLNPLDVTNDEDMAWLDSLVWPEHHARRERLRHAAGIARGTISLNPQSRFRIARRQSGRPSDSGVAAGYGTTRNRRFLRRSFPYLETSHGNRQ